LKSLKLRILTGFAILSRCIGHARAAAVSSNRFTMRSIFRLLVLILAALFFSAAASATDYYSAPGGITSGTCHLATTPCDLTYTLSIAGTGDRISLAPGLYTPTTTLTATFSVSFVGSGSTTTTVKPTGLSGSSCGFYFANTPTVDQVYVSFSAMTIDGSASTSSPVCFGPGANISLDRTVIANSPAAGISTASSPLYSISLLESAIVGNGSGIVINSGISSGRIAVNRSLIAGNTGRGVNGSGAVFGSFTNSTITNNAGGGLTLSGNVGNYISDSTIANNGSGLNSAILGSSVSVIRSVIAGTCSGTFGSYSVESPGNTCNLSGANSLVNVSVGQLSLAALADNGGPTQTLMLQPTSYAIGVAGTECAAVDQRDFVRSLPCDAGAIQANATKSDELFSADFEAF